jgi:hypothetical protein
MYSIDQILVRTQDYVVVFGLIKVYTKYIYIYNTTSLFSKVDGGGLIEGGGS